MKMFQNQNPLSLSVGFFETSPVKQNIHPGVFQVLHNSWGSTIHRQILAVWPWIPPIPLAPTRTFAQVAHLSLEEIGHQTLPPTDSELYVLSPALEPQAAPQRATPVPRAAGVVGVEVPVFWGVLKRC